MKNELSAFVKHRRKLLGLSQIELSDKVGVGLRFVRDLEQGKPTLRLDKINQLLALFNHNMAPTPIRSNTNESQTNGIVHAVFEGLMLEKKSV